LTTAHVILLPPLHDTPAPAGPQLELSHQELARLHAQQLQLQQLAASAAADGAHQRSALLAHQLAEAQAHEAGLAGRLAGVGRAAAEAAAGADLLEAQLGAAAGGEGEVAAQVEEVQRRLAQARAAAQEAGRAAQERLAAAQAAGRRLEELRVCAVPLKGRGGAVMPAAVLLPWSLLG
jgi:hypothetical protein